MENAKKLQAQLNQAYVLETKTKISVLKIRDLFVKCYNFFR